MQKNAWSLLALSFVVAGAALVACGSSTSTTTSDASTADTTGPTSSSVTTGTGGATSSSVSSSSSVTSSSSSSSTGGGCQDLGDACTKCTVQSCNMLYCQCFADAACPTLVMCVQACAPGDTNCTQKCFSASPSAISEGALLSDCAANSCAGSCMGATKLTPCEQCLFTSCSQEMNACLAIPDCTKLIQCAQMCNGDQFCQFQCATQYPNGQTQAQDVGNCLDSKCKAQCM